MIPFCRTVDEADRVLGVLADCGLQCGRNGLNVTLTAKTAWSVVLVGEFAERFDGFSIGRNELAQVVLGVDRD